MENFKKWLINKGFGLNTASDYSKFIEKKFLLYLHEFFLSIEGFEHEHLMQYIRYRKGQGVKAKTINSEIKKSAIILNLKVCQT